MNSTKHVPALMSEFIVGHEDGTVKILIFAKQYLPEISAQSIRISQIARRFCQNDRDLEVRIAAFDPEGRRIGEKDGSENSIVVKRYNRNILPASAYKPQSLNPLLLLFWIRIAVKEINDFGPDIILATTPPFTPTIAIYAASKIGRKRFAYAVDYRDDLSNVINSMAEQRKFYIKYPLKIVNRLMSFLLFKAIRNAALVSTVNEPLQKELQRDNALVMLVPNGLDLQELKDIEDGFDRIRVLVKNGIANTESRIIVYLGDLDMPYYMPEAILEPMKQLKAEGCKLIYVIIGDGKRRNLIEQTARDTGLEGSIYLLGRKNHKDAMELLTASDVAFHTLQKSDPQAKHAIATKVYEYLGCKLPILVLADKGSAVSELVTEKRVGISVSWDELDRIKLSLREILDHPEVYKKNLESCHRYFLDNFDRNKGIDLLYENLKDLRSQKN
jgi:glycosyltransferase involved in cell wall biosynthesis